MSTSDNKWSEDRVDQLLTSFFKDEMPRALRDATDPEPVSVSMPAPPATAEPARRSGVGALAGLAAAAALVVALGTLFNDPAGQPGDDAGLVATEDQPRDGDRPQDGTDGLPESHPRSTGGLVGPGGGESGLDVDMTDPSLNIELHADDEKADDDRNEDDEAEATEAPPIR